MEYLTKEQEQWCADHEAEALSLLRTLGRIPAPSGEEDRRADFVLEWLRKQGAKDARIDSVKNVVCPIGVKPGEPVVVMMAHSDVVFPDTEPLEMHEEDGRLYAPGIGDDTANLVHLMMAFKYVLTHDLQPECGFLFVANSCEEGLGNLKGSRQILQDYAGQVRELVSIDGNMDRIVNDAVGSHRMKVTIHAQGGHSYGAFGNTNAIVQMAELIRRLYQKQVPESPKTTYNVGVIEGGTTVNSIAAECSILYEYRSADADCLADMERFFRQTIDGCRAEGMEIGVEVLGIRPCVRGVDPAKQAELTARMTAIQQRFSGCEVLPATGSTDANSALGIGIPAVTMGAMFGARAHTRGEWVELDSLPAGLKVALAAMLSYFHSSYSR